MRHSTFGELIRFLVVGIANSLIGLAVIFAAKWFLGISDIVANALGYLVGISVSFALNSRWTFMYRGSDSVAMVRFVVATLIAYGANLLTVLAAIDYAGLNGYLGQALGIPAFTLTSFIANKFYVFSTTTSDVTCGEQAAKVRRNSGL